MSVHPTRYGTFEVRWRDITGKQCSKTFKQKAKATAFDREVNVDTSRGLPTAVTVSKHTVATWADAWLEGAHNLRAGGRSLYRRDLDRHILPHIGNIRLAQLTDRDIDKLIAAEAAAGRAPSTLHRLWRTLRAMLREAENRDEIPRTPMRKVKAPRVPKTEMRFLRVDQLEALAVASVLRDKEGALLRDYRPLVLVAGWGGLRWSELAGLRARCVHATGVDVEAQLVDGRRWEEPKGNSRRRVTLPASVLAELTVPEDPEALVFTAPRGGPLGHSNWMRRVFKPAKTAAGVDKAFRFHDLRHTAVSLAIAGGARAKSIQERMGHSSIQVTFDTYGHLLDEVDEAVVAGLETLRSAAKPRLRAV